MNKNVIIVLAGGFLIAVLVAMLVQASLSGQRKEQAVAVKQEAKVEILVAAKPLRTGKDLVEGDLKWQSWPASGLFPGAIQRKGDEQPLDAAKGRLRRAVADGEPLQKSALVGDEKGNFLAATLAPGMRAVTIAVNSLSQVGGFAAPGDFVDVILTYRQRVRIPGEEKNPEVQNTIEKSIQNYASETILQNVKVLAVDQSLKRPAADQAIKPGKSVTLEVDKKGAETLVLASKLGTLSLVLRQLGDQSVTGQTYPIVTDARVTNIYNEVEEEVDRQNAAGQNSKNVRIYSGETVQDLPVGK